MKTARFLWALPGLLPLAAPAFSQPSAETDDDDVFELSPFVVDASQDQGYRAANTLAGTRLNTPLRETPATLSEFTEEFIEDVGITDTMEALEYSVTFDVDSTSNNGNNYQSNDLNIRARGFQNSNFASRDFFRWFIKSDTYNTTRFTFAHGPNSVLFGSGNPGGLVNTITERALFRELNEVELTLDEYGSYRIATDFNRELIDNKLAVRLNLLTEDQRSFRDNEYEDQQRMHIATHWKPFEATSVRLDYERGTSDRLIQRRWTIRDGFTNWRDAGSPGIDFNDFPAEGGGFDFGAIDDYVGDAGGTFVDAPTPVVFSDGVTATPGNLQYFAYSTGSSAHLKEFDVFPKTTGPVTVNTTDGDFYTSTFALEQKVGDNFFVEVSYNKQKNERDRMSLVNHSEIRAHVDIAATLPDGSPNPNFGRYLMLAPNMFHVPDTREGDNFRVTASYQFDTGSEYFGRHQLAALYQDENSDILSERWVWVNTTPLVANRNRISQNRMSGLSYIDPEGRVAPNAFRFDPLETAISAYDLIDPVTGAIAGRVTPEFVQDRLRPRTEDTESLMIAGQSYFLKKKLALTWGFREDTLTQANFVETLADGAYADANPGVLRDQLLSAELGPEEEFVGDTTTYGAVFTPLSWLSLTANFSENFQPQTALNIFNENIGNVVGEGEDYSARFELLEGKLYATLTYFTTSANNSARNAFNEFTRINEIWDTLQFNGVVANPTFVVQGANRSESFEAEGYEFEIVASPTRNITFRANIAEGTNEISAINPVYNGYLEEFVGSWQPHADLVIVTNSNRTVGDNIEWLVDRNASQRLAIGEGSEGHVHLRGNFFGKYTFRDGGLKDFDVGLGARYRSGRTTGFFAGPNGEALEARGENEWLFDLKFGYKRPIMSEKVDMKLQLHIKNLLDNQDIIITEADNMGLPDDYVLQPPRAISLSAKFTF